MSVQQLTDAQRIAIETATITHNSKIADENDKLSRTDVSIQKIALVIFSVISAPTGTLLLAAACYINLFTIVTPLAVTLIAASVASFVYSCSLDDFQLNSSLEEFRNEIHMTIDTMETIHSSPESEESVADKATLKTELKRTLGMLVDRFGWDNMLTYGIPDPIHLRKLMILMGKHLNLSTMLKAWKEYDGALRSVRDEYGATNLYPYEAAIPHIREFSHLWKPDLIESVGTGAHNLEEIAFLGIISEEEALTMRGLLERFHETRAEFNEATLEYRVEYEKIIAGPKAKRDAAIKDAKHDFNKHPVHAHIAKLRQSETKELLALMKEQDGHAQIAKLKKRLEAAKAMAAAYPDEPEFQALVEFETNQQQYVSQEVSDGFEAAKAGIAIRCRKERARLTRERNALIREKERQIESAEKAYERATEAFTHEYHSHVQAPMAQFEAAKAAINLELAEFNAGRSSALAS